MVQFCKWCNGEMLHLMQWCHGGNAAIMQMLQMMQQMQTQFAATKNQDNSSQRQSNTSSHRTRTTTNRYCWTHGACAHSSVNCRSKKPGHQDDATFQDMKGGCTDYVHNN